jgi:hypothetical protein
LAFHGRRKSRADGVQRESCAAAARDESLDRFFYFVDCMHVRDLLYVRPRAKGSVHITNTCIHSRKERKHT